MVCFDVNDNRSITIRVLSYGIEQHFVVINPGHLIINPKFVKMF